ncbi:APC family permease [Frateuria aurantia]
MASQNDEEALAALGYRQELRRGLSLRDLLVYGMVFMVPTAPFAIFGSVFNAAHGMVPLTYLLGWLAMLFTALSYREMSVAFPVAGSVYAYAGRALHPHLGFLAGWALLLDYLLIPTLLYVIGAQAMANVLPAIPVWLWVMVFVVFNTWINLRGIETTARANKAFLYGQLLVLGGFVVLTLHYLGGHGLGGGHWWTPFYNPAAFSPALIFNALSIAVLSFLGFDAVSTLAEEVRGGSRMVGKATLLALSLIASLFILQTWLAALLLPGQTGFANESAANNAFYGLAEQVGGDGFRIVVALTVALGTAIGNALVAQAATSRLLYSMARDGRLPRRLAIIHPVRQVPQLAVLLVAGVSLVLGLGFVGKIALLSSLVNMGGLIAFMLLHLAVMAHFLWRQPSAGTRRWGLHGLVPLAGLLIIGDVMLSADTTAQLGAVLWLGLGLVLLILRRAGARGNDQG